METVIEMAELETAPKEKPAVQEFAEKAKESNNEMVQSILNSAEHHPNTPYELYIPQGAVKGKIRQGEFTHLQVRHRGRYYLIQCLVLFAYKARWFTELNIYKCIVTQVEWNHLD